MNSRAPVEDDVARERVRAGAATARDDGGVPLPRRGNRHRKMGRKRNQQRAKPRSVLLAMKKVTERRGKEAEDVPVEGDRKPPGRRSRAREYRWSIR